MKADYENRTRYYLPRRTYTLLRVDGKSFHTFTEGYDRPFDTPLMACMDRAAQALYEQIEGARLAYVQSDEITVLLTDFGSQHTEAWFDGNLQKIASVAASIAKGKRRRCNEAFCPSARASPLSAQNQKET